MADRSQHVKQIMENQTRYNLNAAVEKWRNELAAQPNLAADDRRELETHLRDAIAGFQQRGLNDEESFWLARRRVGQPQQLGEEFVKADPAKVWRERAFWAVLVLSAFQLWNTACPYLLRKLAFNHFNMRHDSTLPVPFWDNHGTFLAISFPTVMYFMPVFCFVILFAMGRMNWIDRAFRFIFRSQLQFVLMAFPVVLVFHYYDDSVGALTIVPGSSLFFQYLTDLLLTRCLPIMLILLIAWLMPVQNRKTPKRA
jgi:hypothetical protein